MKENATASVSHHIFTRLADEAEKRGWGRDNESSYFWIANHACRVLAECAGSVDVALAKLKESQNETQISG